MNPTLSEHDRRQYRLMLERLALYKDDKIGVQTLITDLESLVTSLDDISPNWKDKFYEWWGILEEVYAVALDEGRVPSSREDLDLIDQAVDDIERLIQSVGISD